MAETVYGRLETVNRLVNDAYAENCEESIPKWWFTCAMDAAASGDLEDADYVLAKIEEYVVEQSVLTPVRNARQLIVALQDDGWSQ